MTGPRALVPVAKSGARRPLIASHEVIGHMLLGDLLGLTVEEALRTRQPHHVIYRVRPALHCLEPISTENDRAAEGARPSTVLTD
ncbi:hypothetical protein [Salana multivorans]